MAAVTEASRQDTVWGNKRVVITSLSSIDNNDTYATGLQTVEQVILGPNAAGATTQMGYTVSGGTVTFKVKSGSLAGQFTFIGT